MTEKQRWESSHRYITNILNDDVMRPYMINLLSFALPMFYSLPFSIDSPAIAYRHPKDGYDPVIGMSWNAGEHYIQLEVEQNDPVDFFYANIGTGYIYGKSADKICPNDPVIIDFFKQLMDEKAAAATSLAS